MKNLIQLHKYLIGQTIWIMSTGMQRPQIPELNLSFWTEEIEEIIIKSDSGGVCVFYKTSSGTIKSEDSLFHSKKEAVEYAISLLKGDLDE